MWPHVPQNKLRPLRLVGAASGSSLASRALAEVAATNKKSQMSAQKPSQKSSKSPQNSPQKEKKPKRMSTESESDSESDRERERSKHDRVCDCDKRHECHHSGDYYKECDRSKDYYRRKDKIKYYHSFDDDGDDDSKMEWIQVKRKNWLSR